MIARLRRLVRVTASTHLIGVEGVRPAVARRVAVGRARPG
jgi:hypothetical protein